MLTLRIVCGLSIPEAAAHGAFTEAVAELGATLTGGEALQNAEHGGVVTPGRGERKVEDAVYTDSPSSVRHTETKWKPYPRGVAARNMHPAKGGRLSA